MKSVAMIAAILCLAGLAAADRNLQSVTTSAQTSQVSILWAAVNGTGSEDIPMTDPRLAATNGPEQVCRTMLRMQTDLGRFLSLAGLSGVIWR